MLDAKILIVDDEPENLLYLTTILEENGYGYVKSAADGEEGLAKVKDFKPDLLVLDIRMPKMSGIAVFNELKNDPETKKLPIIILTGEGEFIREMAALKAAAEDREDEAKPASEAIASFVDDRPEAFLEKPIAPEAFMETVLRVLAEPPRN